MSLHPHLCRTFIVFFLLLIFIIAGSSCQQFQVGVSPNNIALEELQLLGSLCLDFGLSRDTFLASGVQLLSDDEELPSTFPNTTLIVNRAGRVVKIGWNTLPRGDITKYLTAFTAQQVIDIASQNITGTLTKELGNLLNLTQLKIAKSAFYGSIPKEIKSLTRLSTLLLQQLNLDGTLPSEIGQLKSLQQLILQLKYLEGSLPGELSNVSSLVLLQIQNTPMRGTLDAVARGSFGMLRTLVLTGTLLFGTIPSQIGTFTELRQLALSSNRFTGAFPLSLCSLTNLVQLDISSNSFTGTLPTELSNMVSLQQFNVGLNEFSGPLPLSLIKISGLQQLIIIGNSLQGVIPSEIGTMKNLTVLVVADNLLNGTIPTELGQLSKLQTLEMRSCKVSGTIPSEVGMLSNLRSINVMQNMFTGTVPPQIGSLQSLEVITLDQNRFSGTFPVLSKNLKLLRGGSNQFSGSLKFLENMTSLVEINFGSNSFSGEIPSFIRNFKDLNLFRFSENRLTGKIPSELSQLTKLKSFGIENNNLVIDNWDWLNRKYCPLEVALSYNDASELPNPPILDMACSQMKVALSGTNATRQTIGGWLVISGDSVVETNFRQVLLDRNNLEGYLEDYIQTGKDIDILDLSFNRISGTLPSTLFDGGPQPIYSFVELYASKNLISGTLPLSIFGPVDMKKLDLSSNQITGDVSLFASQVFKTFTSADFAYNQLYGSLSQTFMSTPNKNFYLNDNDQLSCVGLPQWCAAGIQFANGSGTGQCFPCSSPCGDGFVWKAEACDDGNQQNGDGCSSNCEIEDGYTCENQPINGGLVLISSAPSICKQKSESDNKGLIIIAVIIPVTCLVMIILLSIFFYNKIRQRDTFILSLSKQLSISKDRLVDESAIELKQVVGEGNFGKVFIGVLHKTTMVAVKQIKQDNNERASGHFASSSLLNVSSSKSSAPSFSDEFQSFISEAKLLSSVPPHPNIVQFLGICIMEKSKSLLLITQFLANQNMQKFLFNHSARIQLADKLHLLLGIASGMNHLSKYHIVHNDLAARNVLVEELVIHEPSGTGTGTAADFSRQLNPKVSDFGMAMMRKKKGRQKDPTKVSLPVRWAAPEILTNKASGSIESDVWSFGVVIYEAVISCSHIPYHGMTNTQVKKLVIEEGFRLSQPEQCPDELYEIMGRCWNEKPSDRPNFEQIYQDLENFCDGSDILKQMFSNQQKKSLQQLPNAMDNSSSTTPATATTTSRNYITMDDGKQLEEALYEKMSQFNSPEDFYETN